MRCQWIVFEGDSNSRYSNQNDTIYLEQGGSNKLINMFSNFHQELFLTPSAWINLS